MGNLTRTLGEVTVDGFLQLRTVELTLHDINYTVGGPATGRIQVTSTGGTLFPGKSFASELKDGADTDTPALAVTGTLDLGTRRFSLDVDQLELNVPDVLNAKATGQPALQLTYTLDGPADQALVSVASLTVNAVALGDAALQVNGLVVRKNGFSLADAVATRSQVTINGFLAMTAVEVRLSNINYTANPGGADNVTGTIGVSSSGAVLFPGSGFQAVISDGNDVDALALVGTVDLAARRFGLDADQTVLTVDGVLSVALPGVHLSYPVNGSADEVLVRVPSLTVRLLALESAPITGQELSIRRNGFSLSNAATDLSDVTIGGFLRLATPHVALANLDYTAGGPVTGSLTITTNAAELFPNQSSTPVVLSDSTVDPDLYVITGQFDFESKAFKLTVDTAEITAQDTIFITVQGATLGYALDGDDSQVILSADAASVVLAQWQMEGTARGLQITKGGQFSVVSLTLNSQGLAKTLGIGGLLPFDITTVEVKFLGDTNGNGRRDPGEVFRLDAFDLRVAGHFDFAKMSALPFTPIIRIGAQGQQRTFDEPGDTFEFTVTVVAGTLRPKDVGPIELGVADLRVGETVVLTGAIVLGGYQNGRWVSSYGGYLTLETSSALGNLSGGRSVTIAGRFNGDTGDLDLVAAFPVSFTLQNRIVVTNARLELGLGFGADSSIALRHLTLISASFERLEIDLGNYLKLSATNTTLNFQPGPDQNIAKFESLTARLPSLGITGTARNFAIGNDGGLKALPGFSVGFDMEPSQTPSLKWPGWLRLRIPHLAIAWPDFNANPDRFFAVLSAAVDALKDLPLAVEGSITGAVIDIDLLKQGRFPLVSLEAASLTVRGPLFGGQASGTLALGLLKMDAAGNRIAPEDLTTPVASRTLYGGIIANFAFSGVSGFEARIGLSERGPLSVYVMAGIPVLLDPVSGLTISNFRAGVTFNNTLPAITDPLALRGNAFRAQSEMTTVQWWEQVQISAINQGRAPPGAGYWDAFNHPMKIEGGATLYSAHLTTHVFKADVDIIISTDGKFLINSRSTYFDTLQTRDIFYADLSKIGDGSAALLYLSDTPVTSPVVTIRGAIVFEYARSDGQPVTEVNKADRFHIRLSGGIDVQAANAVKVTLEGMVDLSFGSSQVDLKFEGKLKLTALGQEVTLLGAAGALHLDTSGSSVKFWGALALTANLGFLDSVGISASGLQVFTLNLSGQDHEEVLNIPGRGPTPVVLKAWSVGFLVQGRLQFKQDASDWFLMEGIFAMELGLDSGLSVVAQGKLHLRAAGVTLLQFAFTGFLQISPRGVAALIDLRLVADLPAAFGASLEFDGQGRLMLNTTSQTVTYILSVSVATVPGGGANRTITVPGGPPGRANQPYLLIFSQASLQLMSLRIQGSFYLLVTPTVLQVEVAGQMDLKVGGTTFFSFGVAGGFQIDNKGVAAALALSLRSGLPEGLGVSLSVSYRLEINTTNEAVQLPHFTLPAGPYERIRADGTLVVVGLRLDGYFEITVGTSMLNVQASATLDLRVAGVSLAKFNVRGGFQLDEYGFAGAVQLGVNVNFGAFLGFKFELTYRVEVNNTGQVREFPGIGITLEAGRYWRIVALGSLDILGLHIQGGYVFTVTDSYVSVRAEAMMEWRVAGVPLFEFQAEGELRIDRHGLVAVLTLQSQSNFLRNLGLDFTTSALLEINTSSRSVTLLGRTLAASSALVQVDGFLEVLGVLRFDGHFTLRRLEDRILFNTQASFRIFGVTIRVESEMALFRDGLVMRSQLSLPQLDAGFFTLKGRFQLELNTTNRTVFGVAPKTARVGVVGAELNLAGLKLSGTVYIGIHEGVGEIEVPAGDPLTASIFNLFTVKVHGFVRSNGKFSMTGTANVTLGRRDLVAISGTASLTISDSSVGGTIAGRLYLLDQDVFALNAEFTISAQDLSLTAGVDFDIDVLNVLQVKGGGSLTLDKRGLAITFNAGAKLFGSIALSVEGEINTIDSRYSIRGSASVSIGGSHLGARGDVSVVFSNYDGVRITLSGSVWASFSIAGIGVTVTAGLSASVGLDGSFSASVHGRVRIHFPGGSVSRGGSVTVHGNLRNGFRIWLSDIANANVFLDVNHNGVRDANEPETLSDAGGNFTFAEATAGDVGTPLRYTPLGRLASFDLNRNGKLDAEEGQLYVVGGTKPDPSTGDPIPGDGPIASDLLTGLSPSTGATLIFFDANKNGRQDAGEVGVVPDADGFYSFIDLAAIRLNNLGRLAPFDTNGNRVIDPAEGGFVLYGGTDMNTGLPNTQVIHLPAHTFGTGLTASANPLSDLLDEVESGGVAPTTAQEAIHAAFGLPTQVDVNHFDPRSPDALDAAVFQATMQAATRVEVLLQTSSVAFADPAVGRAVLLEQLANRVRALRLPHPIPTDANGEPIYVAQLDLTDEGTLTGLISAAAQQAGQPLSANQAGAMARIMSSLNQRVPAGGTGDWITAAASLKKVSQVEAAAAVAAIRGGMSDPNAIAASFVQNLPGYLQGTRLPPYISRVPDQTSTGTTVNVGFLTENPNPVAGTLAVTADVDNATLLPAGSVVLTSGAAGWTLALTPARGLSGDATVTIRATVTFSDGTRLASTEQFQLKVVAVNQAPTMTGLADQTIAENGSTGVLTFTVGDAETPASGLAVTASSNNALLVPISGLVLGGSGATRTLQVTPTNGQSGVVAITVKVSDGVAETVSTFLVTILARNDAPTLALIPNPTFVDPTSPPGRLGLAVFENSRNDVLTLSIGDRESAPDTLVIQFSSDNPHLLTSGSFMLSGTGAQRLLTLVPIGSQSGRAHVIVAISDGTATITRDFDLVVTPVNLPPVISLVDPQTTGEATPFMITVTVDDDHTTPGDLVLAAISSDNDLLPPTGLVWGGSGSARTLTLTPAAGRFGTATITLTVSDGELMNSETFRLKVLPANTAPVISGIGSQQIPQSGSSGVLVFAVSDRELDTSLLTVSAASSNPQLLPQQSLSLAGIGANRVLMISPAAGEVGNALVTLTISDGELSTTASFRVDVVPMTLTVVGWSSAGSHQGAGEVALDIPDDGTFSESRVAGINQLTIRFSTAIDAASFTPDKVGVTGLAAINDQPVDVSGISWTTSLREGNQMGVITFSRKLPDAALYRVSIGPVSAPEGEVLSGDNDRVLTALTGDVNGDLRVDNADVGAVENLRGIKQIDPASTWQVRSDLNQDGRIDNADVGGLYPRRGQNARFIPDTPLALAAQQRASNSALLESATPSISPSADGTMQNALRAESWSRDVFTKDMLTLNFDHQTLCSFHGTEEWRALVTLRLWLPLAKGLTSNHRNQRTHSSK